MTIWEDQEQGGILLQGGDGEEIKGVFLFVVKKLILHDEEN